MSSRRMRTSLYLAVSEDERWQSAPQIPLSLLTAMKQAGSKLATAVKHAGTKRLLSAVAMAGAAVSPAHASIVTMTVTGTVASGVDNTGIFGFGPLSVLNGQNFTLVFTFDDTKGTQTLAENLGQPCGTAITSSPASNPGTAVLQIGTGKWTFGELPAGSTAARLIGTCELGIFAPEGDPANDAIYAEAENIGGFAEGGQTQLSDVNIADATAGQTIPLADYKWQDALSTSKLTTVPLSASIFNSDSFTITALDSSGNTVDSANGTLTPTTLTISGPEPGPPPALQFIPITPCRVADTRNADGPFGGPVLASGTSREFDIPQSACSIPSTAAAYSLNVTVVPNGLLGYLTVWPSGQPQPTVSTLNSDGRVKANAAIVPAGTNGGVSVFVTDPSQVILDIDGYFVPEGTNSALAFYPLTPCRLVDTRNASGPFGGPTLAAGTSRDFPIRISSCAIPPYASAYSLNVTAVPQGGLSYLTMWPSGQAQPLVSTLNAPTGAVTANAAIVPAGASGDVSVYVTNTSDVILDVNGYFASPLYSGLSLYTTTPCRVIDTRNSSGTFNGVLAVNAEGSTCAPPSTAKAYVLNATIVPPGALDYLTLWPDGEGQPVVSTLNAGDGAVTSNMAIVPTNNGSIEAFSSNPTQLILDISSYFAP